MTRLTVVATAITSALCLLAGCQASGPAPTSTVTPVETTISTPSPTPSPTCTPEAGGAEYPCTQAQYDELKAKDALYAEAEAVYREFYAESVRISRAGGVSEPTEVLLMTLSGAALDNIKEIFAGMRDRGIHTEGDDPQLQISRLPGRSKAGSIVALSVCIDSRGWSYYRKSEVVAPGRVGIDEVYFSRVDSDLKIIGTDGKETAKCS